MKLPYRPPLAWAALTNFLVLRAAGGVEAIEESPAGRRYVRAVKLGDVCGWITVSDVAGENALVVKFSDTLAPLQTQLAGRLRNLFDLDADPCVIDAHLRRDPRLQASVDTLPGLRVPGAFDGFELALRTVVGQQISVRAATTVYGRCARRFGDGIGSPVAAVSSTGPVAERIAATSVEDIAALGMPRRRAQTVQTLARAFVDGQLRLETGGNPGATRKQLVALPGIGEWTAQYLSMRGLGDADAFPAADLGVQRALAVDTKREAEAASRRWRPWRAYAVMHLWQVAAGG